MTELPPGARLLGVHVQVGAGLGEKLGHVGLGADDVEHHASPAGGGRTEGHAANGADVVLKAEGDLRLLGAANTSELHRQSSSKSGTIGVVASVNSQGGILGIAAKHSWV